MGLNFLNRSAEEQSSDAASPWPEDESGWQSRYQILWDAYLGKDYGADVIKHWHLFRAIDDAGGEIDATYRVFRDFAFLVNTYSASVAGVHPGPVLESKGDKPRLDAGELIWRRSGVLPRVGGWAKMTGVFGHGGWEVVRTNARKPYATQLVYRDARECRVYYDATKTRLVKVVIEVGYVDEAELKALNGVTDSPILHTYRRVLTPTRVDVYRDGRLVAEESGEHGLGAVPFAHAVWIPFTEPEHGLPSGAPLDRAVAMMDSVMCMARAIGNRNAAPMGVLKGAKLSANNAGKVGNVYHGIPADGSFEYLETDMAGVGRMLEVAAHIHEHIRRTDPAYIFGDSSAAESGEAKAYRAAAFEAAVSDIRTRFYGALTTATEMAVASDAGRPYVPDDDALVVNLPGILPRSVAADVRAYSEVKGDMRRADRVRWLQRVGFVPPEHDPEAYAAEVGDEQAEAAGMYNGGEPVNPGAGGGSSTEDEGREVDEPADE